MRRVTRHNRYCYYTLLANLHHKLRRRTEHGRHNGIMDEHGNIQVNPCSSVKRSASSVSHRPEEE
jgi:hypothetical protein